MSIYPKLESNRFDASWMLRLVAISFIGAEMASAQLSPDDLNTLITRHEDGADSHEIALAISGVERALREGAEAAKLPGTIQAIDLAATIYRTHDTTVPTDRSVGRWPDFDATKFGEKPIFLGSDLTKYFTNPEATEAYKQALATHEKLLTRVSTEMHKLEEGDYCARVAFRVIESSINPAALREKVETHIASIKDAQWVRERLTQIVLPKPRPTEQTQPQNEPSGSQATLQSQPSVATSTLQTVRSRAPKKAPPTTPTSSTPSEEPASSNPLSVIVVLIVAAIGLLWLLFKRRS